uniref:ribosomal protein L28 n=1 Tax=Timspurckia oligopyrenoides TaxID=708627 RepID=UPI001FCCCA01|nr:ribosomal protein L28 [Timspurckia oligopyrenoides]UNJ17443.1 ribosomal protein L28 [Timspurckia oligopyrenoides]
MAKICQVTGKKANNGYQVSHSHIRSHKLQNVNLQVKKVWDEKRKQWIKVKISTKALKTMSKKQS